MHKTLAIKPRISEKAYGLSRSLNVYVFDVPAQANKLTVAKAVEAQYGVNVTAVRIVNIKGKAKRSIIKGRATNIQGSQPAVSKAYVSVQAGQTLPFFAVEEEAEKEAAKEAKKEVKKSKKRAEK